MQHPLRFKKAIPILKSVWGNCKRKNYYVETPKILHSVWRQNDGKIMVVFVNTVNEKITIEPDVEFKNKTLFVCSEDRLSPEIINLKNGKLPIVRLAPYGTKVWLFSGAQQAVAEANAIAAVQAAASRYDNGKTLNVLGSVRQYNIIRSLRLDNKKYLKVQDALRFRHAYQRPRNVGGAAEDKSDKVLLVQSGGYISYPAVEFGNTPVGALEVLIAADKSNKGGSIEFFLAGKGDVKSKGNIKITAKNRLDFEYERRIERSVGKITVDNTGGWYTFKNIRVPLTEKLTGNHNIIIKFSGKACCFKGWRAAGTN
jgi:hypothetical protein